MDKPRKYNSRPADRSDMEAGRTLHNECLGSVQREYYGQLDFFGYPLTGPWECSGCRRKWSSDTVERWMLADIEDRFHVRIDAPSSEYVLVWEVDPVTGMRHIRLVGNWEARGKEKVRL